MVSATLGLTDNQRTVLGIIFSGIIAIVIYLGTLPAESKPPTVVFAILGGIVILVNIVKDQLGIKESTTSAVSKTTNAAVVTDRVPPPTTPTA